MRKILLSIVATFCLTAITTAQNVPTYVPTNGLVGWWPFNGNANDESGNGNNGTVNGATLTSDRFGNANKAFSFTNNSISFINSNFAAFGLNSFSSSVWAKFTNPGNNLGNFVRYGNGVNGAGWGIRYTGNSKINCLEYSVTNNNVTSGFAYNDNNWHNIIFVKDVNNLSILLYIDGVLTNTVSMASGYLNNISVGLPLNIGTANGYESFIGSLDDIGIWNRALTTQEITNLNNGNICYQNITVTDTLLINMGITGFNPVAYQNTIKVWPNPTNDHITIDNGNLANLNGYQIKIMNSLSQQVFQSAITQQQFYIDLSSWTGNGIYFVHIIDGQGNTVDVKKIILQ